MQNHFLLLKKLKIPKVPSSEDWERLHMIDPRNDEWCGHWLHQTTHRKAGQYYIGSPS